MLRIERQSDGTTNAQFATVQLDWLRHRIDDLCRQWQTLLGRRFAVQEHQELIASQTRHAVGPGQRAQALRDALQHPVAELMAKGLNVVGLMNVQFAIQGRGADSIVYVLEVNPRASRTVPFVSKATGLPLAKIAARCMAGRSLADQDVTREVIPPYYSVKEAVFPFAKFPGVDTLLGPEMKSTGEVMGVGRTFGEAFVKSQIAASTRLPAAGRALITVKSADKAKAVEVGRLLHELGFTLLGTRGTAAALQEAGIPVAIANKVNEGRPHIVDMIKNNEIVLIVNTVDEKRTAVMDSRSIRTSALSQKVTLFTTIEGARAACVGMRHSGLETYSIQQLHAELEGALE